MNNSRAQALRSVNDVMSDRTDFHVPDYQRGYKWTTDNVYKLLEDIDRFTLQGGMSYYCLQNITLLAVKENGKERMQVIDGQQRLTTIFVIMSYFKFKTFIDGFALNLTYDARQEITGRFLEEIRNDSFWSGLHDLLTGQNLLNKENESHRFSSDILADVFDKQLAEWKKEGKTDRNHSDIFHLFCAASTVVKYFAQRSDQDQREFVKKLREQVKLIWNQVVGGGDEAEVFSQINGFRVPLDGADLLRAIFITDVVRQTVRGGEIEREVRIGEERLRLGLELDEMNAWWSNPRHADYFAMFDSDVSDVNASFDVIRYPINHLYKLFVASKGENEIRLEYFESNEMGVVSLYREIRSLHAILKDWYDDPIIYHYAGYLRGQGSIKFTDICDLLKKPAESRKDLYEEIKDMMFSVWHDKDEDEKSERKRSHEAFESTRNSITNNGHNWYDDDSALLKRTLILLDVIAVTKKPSEEVLKGSTPLRNPLTDHLDASFFTCKNEDKEHVFPQTPIGGQALTNLDALNKCLKDNWGLIEKNFKVELSDDGKQKGTLDDEWKAYWESFEAVNSLGRDSFPLLNLKKDDLKWLLADNKRAFDETKKRINGFIAKICGIDLNSIGNIVLLDRSINRSYGNDFYPRKRRVILRSYRDQKSIRLHTRAVFAKEFVADIEDEKADLAAELDVWDQKSIEANRKYIADEIEAFFFGDIKKEVENVTK